MGGGDMGLNPKVILLVDDSGDTCGRGRYRAICTLRRLQKSHRSRQRLAWGWMWQVIPQVSL